VHKHYLIHLSAFTLCLALLAGCMPETGDFTKHLPPEGKYTVKILRDTWGVPHLYGKTDADTAYGLAWAQCEDDFHTVQEGMFLARGRLSLLERFKALPFDYMVLSFKYREMVEEHYESALSPETRALCQAYADGVNHYAAVHPETVLPGLQPVSGVDVVLGFVMKSPMFFGFAGELQKLMGPERTREVSEKVAARYPNIYTDNREIGSNTIAVAPSRTPDGKTHLAVNSHQPWTGPVAWYEVRLKSEEGLDITGGTFPGAPVVLHGHNRHLGWAHTVNTPDLADIYVLEMHPEKPDYYRFGDEWLALEKERITLHLRLWGNLCVKIPRTIYS
jgi:acyl-homoserine-lactone acylase